MTPNSFGKGQRMSEPETVRKRKYPITSDDQSSTDELPMSVKHHMMSSRRPVILSRRLPNVFKYSHAANTLFDYNRYITRFAGFTRLT
jgi:hypothetical protein